jgi:hypothetical protein
MEAALNGPTGRILLGPVPLTIGRMPGSQLLMTDSQSSGYHAEIRQEGRDTASSTSVAPMAHL